jgi:1,4-alpha-glucan branching enzyme
MSKRLKPKSAKQLASVQCACLEFIHPDAREVFVAGSFNDWSPTATPMANSGAGRWVKELVLPPGRHQYRFIVDGQWVDDPKANEFVPNPHGGQNAVLVVAAP